MPLDPLPSNERTVLLRSVVASVPPMVVASSVVIVSSVHRVLRQIGTGTLLAVADRRFVVTAAHVVRDASEAEATLGVSGTSDLKFFATGGEWLLSKHSGAHGDADLLDVAIYPLAPDQAARFDDAAFVRIADVSFDADMSNGYFVIFGFPGMWANISSDDQQAVELRGLQYATDAYIGTTAGLGDYDARYHLLLNATPDELLDHHGKAMQFRTLGGHPAQISQDLGGVSGCSVWLIGDLRTATAKWSAKDGRLVGVETGTYPNRGVIKATRWNAVTTLLYASCPDLRPVLRLYEHA